MDLLGEVQLLGGNKIMDFLTLIDTWWFRVIMLPIEIIIFYYVAKWPFYLKINKLNLNQCHIKKSF